MIWYQKKDKEFIDLSRCDHFCTVETDKGFACCVLYGEQCPETCIEVFESFNTLMRFMEWLLKGITNEDVPKSFSEKEYLVYEDFEKFCSD